MNKMTILTLVSPLLLLTGCSGAEAPAEYGKTSENVATETEFDQQLTAADADAAFDALDAEDAAAVTAD